MKRRVRRGQSTEQTCRESSEVDLKVLIMLAIVMVLLVGTTFILIG